MEQPKTVHAKLVLWKFQANKVIGQSADGAHWEIELLGIGDDRPRLAPATPNGLTAKELVLIHQLLEQLRTTTKTMPAICAELGCSFTGMAWRIKKQPDVKLRQLYAEARAQNHQNKQDAKAR